MSTGNVQNEKVQQFVDHVESGEQYIEKNLTRFMHILRHLGIRISSAEVVDAVKALASVDMLDGIQVLTAFKATLAKSPEDRLILEKAFRAFFVTPEQKAERTEKRKEREEIEAQEMQAAEEEISYQVEGPQGEEQRDVTIPLTDEEKKTYSKLPENQKKRLNDYLNKQFQSNSVNNPEELITSMIKSSLNYWKYYLKLQDDGPPEINYTGEEEIDEILQEVAAELRDDEQLYYKDIEKITETDMPTAASLIAKLSRRLATRISRRYHRSKKRQRLDIRRTIRHNIRFGGTMFNLKYKTKKIEKPRIVLICDVSGSMAKYAAFVLQFMYGLSSSVQEIESFIFSEEIERVTDEFKKPQSFDITMTEIINRSESWGRGTDFNKALAVITGSYRHLLNKDTFIIIVSDTKTLNAEKSGARLSDLKKKVKDIVWLNTLPKKVWSSAPTVSIFSRHSRMFECNTLAHLDRIMRSQMLK